MNKVFVLSGVLESEKLAIADFLTTTYGVVFLTPQKVKELAESESGSPPFGCSFQKSLRRLFKAHRGQDLGLLSVEGIRQVEALGSCLWDERTRYDFVLQIFFDVPLDVCQKRLNTVSGLKEQIDKVAQVTRSLGDRRYVETLRIPVGWKTSHKKIHGAVRQHLSRK